VRGISGPLVEKEVEDISRLARKIEPPSEIKWGEAF
jgi:hypothetical protein